jgi:predicted chitinase
MPRKAHFIAQIAHESGGFRTMRERLSYSAERIAEVWKRLAPRAQELAHNPVKLANAAYANTSMPQANLLIRSAMDRRAMAMAIAIRAAA